MMGLGMVEVRSWANKYLRRTHFIVGESVGMRFSIG